MGIKHVLARGFNLLGLVVSHSTGAEISAGFYSHAGFGLELREAGIDSFNSNETEERDLFEGREEKRMKLPSHAEEEENSSWLIPCCDDCPLLADGHPSSQTPAAAERGEKQYHTHVS